jgi:putative FmdB family regulatory protein
VANDTRRRVKIQSLQQPTPHGRRSAVGTLAQVPTYEYTCRDCGHTFDIVQKMTDEPLTVCPECGGTLRKVFAVPAIAFKGSGFYATDHGKKAKQPSETPENKTEKKPEKKGTTTTDAKGDAPATKKESTGPTSSKEGSGS